MRMQALSTCGAGPSRFWMWGVTKGPMQHSGAHWSYLVLPISVQSFYNGQFLWTDVSTLLDPLVVAYTYQSLRIYPLWQNRLKQHAFGGARLPPDTKHPESKLHRTVPSSTPQGRTQTIHVFHLGFNNEYEFTILSPFHTTRVLRNYLLQYQSSQCDN